MINDDIAAELPFPLKGVDKRLSFSAQPSLTTPLGRNVRAHEPRTLRAKGGSRPGLSRFVDQSLGGPLQGLFLVATTDAGAPWFRALAESPPALPDGYTADPSTAGPQALWGTGTGEHTTQTPPPPARGGPGGGEYGGGGPGTQYQSRVPPNRVRTGGTGYPPHKNAPRQETPAVTWTPTTTEYVVGTPLNHPAPSVTDSDDTFPLPVVTDPKTGRTVPGTWTFTPVAGTTITAGSNVITGVFTPDDNKYAVVKTTTTLTGVPNGFVQKKTALESGPLLTAVVTPDATVTAGNLLVMVVGTDTTAATVAITDDRAGGWAQAVPSSYTTGAGLHVWYKYLTQAELGAAKAAITVRVTASAQQGGLALALLEYDTSIPLSVQPDSGTNNGSSVAPTASWAGGSGYEGLAVFAYAVPAGAEIDVVASSTTRVDPLAASAGARVGVNDWANADGTSFVGSETLATSSLWAAALVVFN
jgi:hypothetical protein